MVLPRARWSAALPLLALAGCVAPPKPVARPPAPPPAVVAPPPVLGADWRDWPVTPGRWTFWLTPVPAAAFAGTDGAAAFELRCDPAARQMLLSRTLPAVAAPRTMTITTSDGVRALPLDGARASLSARDPFLDRMAFSRGRIVVAADGGAPLVLPAWAEIGRVVEECRG